MYVHSVMLHAVPFRFSMWMRRRSTRTVVAEPTGSSTSSSGEMSPAMSTW